MIRALLIPLAIFILPISLLVYGGSSTVRGYREIRVENGTLTAHVLTTGRVQPENRIDIKAPIPGRVEQILVQEGDLITRGQILMWMNSAERASLLDAAVAKSGAEFRHWEKKIPLTPIIAPVDGRVIQRNVQPGQLFTETEALFVIADRLIVEAPVDEVDLARLSVGQAAVTTLDSDPSREIRSHVTSISYDAREVNQVTMFMSKVALDDKSPIIRVGMTANVNFELESKHGVRILPTEALRSEGQDFYVLIPPEHGWDPEKLPVRIGISSGKEVEILEGPNAGDIVLIPPKPEPSRIKIDRPAF